MKLLYPTYSNSQHISQLQIMSLLLYYEPCSRSFWFQKWHRDLILFSIVLVFIIPARSVALKPTSFRRTSCCFSRSSLQAPEGTTLSPICPGGRGELQSERKKERLMVLTQLWQKHKSVFKWGLCTERKRRSRKQKWKQEISCKEKNRANFLVSNDKKQRVIRLARLCSWRGC